MEQGNGPRLDFGGHPPDDFPRLQVLPVRGVTKPNLKKCWCIPPEHNAAFAAAMEDMLEVYKNPPVQQIGKITMNQTVEVVPLPAGHPGGTTAHWEWCRISKPAPPPECSADRPGR